MAQWYDVMALIWQALDAAKKVESESMFRQRIKISIKELIELQNNFKLWECRTRDIPEKSSVEEVLIIIF